MYSSGVKYKLIQGYSSSFFRGWYSIRMAYNNRPWDFNKIYTVSYRLLNKEFALNRKILSKNKCLIINENWVELNAVSKWGKKGILIGKLIKIRNKHYLIGRFLIKENNIQRSFTGYKIEKNSVARTNTISRNTYVYIWGTFLWPKGSRAWDYWKS